MLNTSPLASVPALPDSPLTATNIPKALVAVSSLALALPTVLPLRKRPRLLNENVPVAADAQPFATLPDDGQTITVYAKKSRVVLYVIQLTLVAGVSTAAGVWMWSDPRYQVGAVLAALLDLLLAPFLVLAIARLISRSPVLIVSAEGITDNASFIATGFGQIAWREILGLGIYVPARFVYGFSMPSNFRILSTRSLTIAADDDTIVRRQPRWKRAFVALATPALDSVRIYEFLLPMPLEQLRAQIEEYLQAHGHTLPLTRAMRHRYVHERWQEQRTRHADVDTKLGGAK